jgi:uncharacterized protein (DUF952 family)
MTTARQFVFKVMPRAAWEDACRSGVFIGSADDVRDGYIHLSTREQIAGTLAKHFRDNHDLVLIQFETHVLGEPLRWEVSRGGDLFPHLYAALPTASAGAVLALPLGTDGVPMLPKELAAC